MVGLLLLLHFHLPAICTRCKISPPFSLSLKGGPDRDKISREDGEKVSFSSQGFLPLSFSINYPPFFSPFFLSSFSTRLYDVLPAFTSFPPRDPHIYGPCFESIGIVPLPPPPPPPLILRNRAARGKSGEREGESNKLLLLATRKRMGKTGIHRMITAHSEE